ncbi:TPA: hypothetical protein ACH3X1_002504 [Trebouxia sp. C0004]
MQCVRSHIGSSRHVTKILLASMYSTFWSLPSTAVEIPALSETALSISGTLFFQVRDVFYECQRRQDGDMMHYLPPVSQSATVKFSSKIHDVLTKSFPRFHVAALV